MFFIQFIPFNSTLLCGEHGTTILDLLSSGRGHKMDVPFGFNRVELNKTEWIVPNRYQDLTAIGGGAFGQVW